MIKVSETEERADIFDFLWNSSFADCRDLFGIHFDTVDTDDETKILHFTAVKLALLGFEVQASGGQSLQHLTNVYTMFF
jgi:hypothetical protein